MGSWHHSKQQALETPCRRYRIAGQHALRLPLLPGERLSITSPDGEQGCDLLALDQDNQAVTASMGIALQPSAALTQRQLEQGNAAAKRLKARFDSWQIDTELLSQGGHIPGRQLPLELSCPLDSAPLTLVLVAPGNDMAV